MRKSFPGRGKRRSGILRKSKVKKKSHHTSHNIEFSFPPGPGNQFTNLSFIENSEKNSLSVFKNRKSIVWHISDLHIAKTKRLFGYGHCPTLVNIFIDLLKYRGDLVAGDYFILSGDLTDTGSEEDFFELNSFFAQLRSCGVSDDKIFAVPGNHDSWAGASRLKLIGSYFSSEGTYLSKSSVYEPRKYKEPLTHFNQTCSAQKSIIVNGRSIEITLINTSILHEMARGVFPSQVQIPNKSETYKIAVMHHHLITPEAAGYEYGFTFLKTWFHRPAMRVINGQAGLDFLFENGYHLSLHGHKHLQYFKQETPLQAVKKSVFVVSSPSLCENNYDRIRGDQLATNRIGFNLIVPHKKSMELVQLELKDRRFRIWNSVNLE